MKTSFLIALYAIMGAPIVAAFSSCCFEPPYGGLELDGTETCAECDPSCHECLSTLQLCKQVSNDDNAQLCSQQGSNWVADSNGAFCCIPPVGSG